jgi:hypothetical protein
MIDFVAAPAILPRGRRVDTIGERVDTIGEIHGCID